MKDTRALPTNARLAALDPARKADMVEACRLLLDGPLQKLEPGRARVRFGRLNALGDPITGEIEAALRPLWGLIPLLGAGNDHGFASRLPGLLAAGTDPGGPDFWGMPASFDQRFVEMAVLGLALRMLPDRLWDPLDPPAQARLQAWLGTINRHELPNNNWMFFRVFVNLGLRRIGAPAYDAAALRESLDSLERMYRGHGWYGDGLAGRTDWYIAWAFHFYGCLFAWLSRDDPDAEPWERESGAILAGRAAEWLPSQLAWFAQDGTGLAYGRSLGYRFAQSAGLGALALAGPADLPWGVLAGAWRRNMAGWMQKPLLDQDGILPPGYGYPNARLGEPYSSHGSPYWAMKAFLPLLLAEDHPFWTAPSEPLPTCGVVSQEQWKATLWRGVDGHVTALTGGQVLESWAGNWPSTYGKFAYGTAFPPSIQTGPEVPALDGVLLLSADGTSWIPPLDRTSASLPGGVIRLLWGHPSRAGIITFLIARPPWHLRVHLIENPQALKAIEGGFALNADTTRIRRVSAGSAFLSGEGGSAQILGPPQRAGAILDEAPGINLGHPRTLVPCLRDALPPGRNVLLCAVWSTAGSGAPPPAGAPQWITGGAVRFLGEDIPLPL